MSTYSCTELTDAAARTILSLTKSSRGEAGDADLSNWDKGCGVALFWAAVAGGSASPADRERLMRLLQAMPGYHASEFSFDAVENHDRETSDGDATELVGVEARYWRPQLSEGIEASCPPAKHITARPQA